MSKLSQRSKIFFELGVHKARRIKAAKVGSSISDIIQEALSLLFVTELKGIADFDARIGHHNVGYAEFRQPL